MSSYLLQRDSFLLAKDQNRSQICWSAVTHQWYNQCGTADRQHSWLLRSPYSSSHRNVWCNVFLDDKHNRLIQLLWQGRINPWSSTFWTPSFSSYLSCQMCVCLHAHCCVCLCVRRWQLVVSGVAWSTVRPPINAQRYACISCWSSGSILG